MSNENRVSDERLTELMRLHPPGSPMLPSRDVHAALAELQSLRSKPVAGVEVKPELLEATSSLQDISFRANELGIGLAKYPVAEIEAVLQFVSHTLSTLSLPAQEPAEDEGSRQAAVDIADAVMKWMVKYDLLDPEHEYFDHDIIEVLNDLAPVEEARILYRHQKRGTVYELIGIGKMQAEGWHASAPGFAFHVPVPVDISEVAVYRSVDNPDEIWVRPRGEFEDGRFAALKEA